MSKGKFNSLGVKEIDDGDDVYVYEYIGTADIVDDQDQQLDMDNIEEGLDIAKRIFKGYVPITLGHHDMPIARATDIERTSILDPVMDNMVDALKMKVELPILNDTTKDVHEKIEAGKLDSLSISGKIHDREVKCDSDKCYDYIKKADYFSFALVSKPHNRLAELVKKGDIDTLRSINDLMEANEDLTDCDICSETIDFYKSIGHEEEKAIRIMKGVVSNHMMERSIMTDKKDDKEDKLDEISKGVSDLSERVEALEDRLKKASEESEESDEKEDSEEKEDSDEDMEKGCDDDIEKGNSELLEKLDTLIDTIKKSNSEDEETDEDIKKGDDKPEGGKTPAPGDNDSFNKNKMSKGEDDEMSAEEWAKENLSL